MAAKQDAERPGLPLAPVAAGAAGLVVALAIALVPAWRVEAAVIASGLPGLLPAAAPPLGLTARIGLMLGFGGTVTVLLWGALVLLAPHAMIGGRRRAKVAAGAVLVIEPPVVRRADAHPDAPPRPPVNATRDLGAPFLETTAPVAGPDDAEVALPADLDTPLALFDPLALPAVPAAPPAAVKPLFRAEPRIEPAPEPEAEAHPVDAPPLADLLARLDAGLARRSDAAVPVAAPPAPAPKLPAGLAATLGQLRRMATRD